MSLEICLYKQMVAPTEREESWKKGTWEITERKGVNEAEMPSMKGKQITEVQSGI